MMLTMSGGWLKKAKLQVPLTTPRSRLWPALHTGDNQVPRDPVAAIAYMCGRSDVDSQNERPEGIFGLTRSLACDS